MDSHSSLSSPSTPSRITPVKGQDVHKIVSNQVITSIASAVKELLENSLDAGATVIEIRFWRNGVDGFQVIDNGTGIPKDSHNAIARWNATSKIEKYEDLSCVGTHGFRGEALAALCSLSNTMTVVTCTEPPYGTSLEFDRSCRVVEKQAVTAKKGTTVTVEGLFSAFVVRKMEWERNMKREFTKALKWVEGYALIRHAVRISVWNTTGTGKQGASLLLATTGTGKILDAAIAVMGIQQAKQLLPFDFCRKDNMGTSHGLVSRPDWGSGRSTTNRQYLYLNGRPCEIPNLAKAINSVYRNINSHQYPVLILELILPNGTFDVNVTPDKRIVLLHDERDIIEWLSGAFTTLFEPSETRIPHVNSQATGPGPRSSASDESVPARTARHGDLTPKRAFPENIFDRIRKKKHKMFETVVLSSEDDLPLVKEEPTVIGPSSNDDGDGGSTVVGTASSQTLIDPLGRGKQVDRPAQRTDEGSLPQRQYIDLSDNNDSSAFTMTLMSLDDHNRTTKAVSHGGHDSSTIPTKYRPCPREENSSEQPYRPLQSLAAKDADENVFHVSDEEEQDVVIDSILDSVDDSYGLAPARSPRTGPGTMVDSPALLSPSCGSREPPDSLPSEVHHFKTPIHQTPAELSRNLHKSTFLDMSILGQFNKGFIITHNPRTGEIFIVDQHASDEKFRYETLRACVEVKCQALLKPLPLVDLTPADEELVMCHRHVFEKNGFVLEERGEETGSRLWLTGLPALGRTLFDRHDFEELVGLLQEGSGQVAQQFPRPSKLTTHFASRACRSAVMIGMSLGRFKMERIVRNMAAMDQPWNCPHGRPTVRFLYDLKEAAGAGIRRRGWWMSSWTGSLGVCRDG